MLQMRLLGYSPRGAKGSRSLSYWLLIDIKRALNPKEGERENVRAREGKEGNGKKKSSWAMSL